MSVRNNCAEHEGNFEKKNIKWVMTFAKDIQVICYLSNNKKRRFTVQANDTRAYFQQCHFIEKEKKNTRN